MGRQRLEYSYAGHSPDVKRQIAEMALNAICHTEELAQRHGLTSEFDLVIGLFLKRYEFGRTHLTGNQQL